MSTSNSPILPDSSLDSGIFQIQSNGSLENPPSQLLVSSVLEQERSILESGDISDQSQDICTIRPQEDNEDPEGSDGISWPVKVSKIMKKPFPMKRIVESKEEDPAVHISRREKPKSDGYREFAKKTAPTLLGSEQEPVKITHDSSSQKASLDGELGVEE